MKTKLGAYSLVETLVASVIFLAVFIIATDVLGNLAAHDIDYPGPVAVEREIERCRADALDVDEMFVERTYDYPWGCIIVSLAPHETVPELRRMTVSARTRGGNVVTYKYIETYSSR
mgnify:CR=1 FL=1